MPRPVARRRLAVEVIQSSAMDCGPAALKCLLEGFGVPISYGRLREACQTDVDGTSIDTLEEIAISLGLDAEQVMLPLDHVLLAEAAALPALIVTRTPGGMTHFVVLWATRAGFVQIMDPARGRVYASAASFLREVYHHRMAVPAEDFLEWASSDDFLDSLRRRLADLGVARGGEAWIAEALATRGWRALARLDAAVRMVAALVSGRALRRGGEARRVLGRILAEIRGADDEAVRARIPDSYFMATAADDPEEVVFAGAVLLRVRGVREEALSRRDPAALAEEGLSPDLIAALTESTRSPLRELFGVLRGEGDEGGAAPGWMAAALSVGLVGAAAAVLIEAILLRGLIDVGARLGLGEQRLGVAATVALFLALALALEWALALGLRHLGRHLDGRLRVAFVTAIPSLGDRYLASRPISDMAERVHAGHVLRSLPQTLAILARALFEIIFTALGLLWLSPSSAPQVIIAAFGVLIAPVLLQAALGERDLRVRSHTGALSRFYLDALLGVAAIRTHGAERALRREHEGLLVEWSRAFRSLSRLQVIAIGFSTAIGLSLAVLLLGTYLGAEGEPAGALLLVYWALSLPSLGERFAAAAFTLPALRNVALRLLEPLQAPEAGSRAATAAPLAGPDGVALGFSQVDVIAGGHSILSDLNLRVAPGEHVAIVGPSGAGKSSLIGLLLGWHRSRRGRITVDGRPLDAATLAGLREVSAWVDPAVQLWNASLLDNLRYGNPEAPPLESAIERADLGEVLERLPEGLQTQLGEGGALISGGEGQRVRLARALLRPSPRLVLLDEALRGLDRSSRHELLARARTHWRRATLLCVTHDISATLDFPRVLVVEGGRVVEDGAPAALADGPGSRFRALLDEDRALTERGWGDVAWRHVHLEAGRVREEGVS